MVFSFLKKPCQNLFFFNAARIPGPLMICIIRSRVDFLNFLKSASEVPDPGGIEKSVSEAPWCFLFLKKKVKTCFFFQCSVDPEGSHNLFHAFWGGFLKIFEKCLRGSWPWGYQKICFWGTMVFSLKKLPNPAFFAPPKIKKICHSPTFRQEKRE